MTATDRVSDAPGHSGVMRTVNPIQFLIVYTAAPTTARASVAACSEQCAQAWLTATAVRYRDAEVRRGSWAPQASCAACGWCSVLVTRPDDVCRAHGHPADCPDHDPMATITMARAAMELRSRTGRPLTAQTFAYLAQAAERQVDSGVYPDVNKLIAAVWDVRLDWERP